MQTDGQAGRQTMTDRDTERQRQTDRQIDRDRETDRQRQTETDRERRWVEKTLRKSTLLPGKGHSHYSGKKTSRGKALQQ